MHLPSDPITVGSGVVRTAALAGVGMHPSHPADDGRRHRTLPPMPKADTPSTADMVSVPRATRPGERPRTQRIVPLGSGRWDAALAERDTFGVDALTGDDAERVYAHLVSLAARSAAKGRLLAGSVGRQERDHGVSTGAWSDPAPSIPSAHRVEDNETAADAVSAVWHRASTRGEAIEVRLVRTVARRMGARRAQHRLRERSGLVESVDHRMPTAPVTIGGQTMTIRAAFDAGTLTIEQLVASVPHGRRAAFERAIAKRNYARARKTIAETGAKVTSPV